MDLKSKIEVIGGLSVLLMFVLLVIVIWFPTVLLGKIILTNLSLIIFLLFADKVASKNN
jgi:hypothetical protein